jgi:hypothetical protein
MPISVSSMLRVRAHAPTDFWEARMKDALPHKRRSDEIDAAFRVNYPAVQYVFVQFISEHLADCSREFNGDMQQLLILAVIGQVFLADFMRAKGPPLPDETNGISASRLADVCKIPRETVRRKLKLLEEKNWICQNGEQSWTLVHENGVSTAGKWLDALDRRGMLRLSRLHAALERISAPQNAQIAGPGADQWPDLFQSQLWWVAPNDPV